MKKTSVREGFEACVSGEMTEARDARAMGRDVRAATGLRVKTAVRAGSWNARDY
jgi:hypothetical protein